MSFFLERKKEKENWIVLGLFILLLSIVSAFHEPWFDEAQAWQIAKCASLREILFVIPHYEGHPPLWHLVLCLPAKLGFPYELSLKTISIIISFFSVFLIVFFSPFNKMVRYALPFSYFIFYQFGVVSRPYNLTVLSLLLLALLFNKKNDKPVLFVLANFLLVLTCTYGMFIAAGICFVWLMEILSEDIKKKCFLDKRLWFLALLLLSAFIIVWLIFPAKDAYAMSNSLQKISISSIVSGFCISIADSVLLSIMDTDGFVATTSFSNMICAIFIAIFVISLIVFSSTKRTVFYFIIPYFFFACFCSFGYFCAHHMGILFALFLFWLWISKEKVSSNNQPFIYETVLPAFSTKIRTIINCGLIGALLVSTVWTSLASINDVIHPYYYSRETASFIKQNNLQGLNIMSKWISSGNDSFDINFASYPTAIVPYFDENIFSNFNNGDDKAYITHKVLSSKETKEMIKTVKQRGIPDVIVGTPDNGFDSVFDNFDFANYVPIYQMKSSNKSIWKWYYSGEEDFNYDYVYIRKDLVEEYGLEPIDADPLFYPYPIS